MELKTHDVLLTTWMHASVPQAQVIHKPTVYSHVQRKTEKEKKEEYYFLFLFPCCILQSREIPLSAGISETNRCILKKKKKP